jgi:hypothetical protein
MFAFALNQPRQLYREHPLIKGLVGLGKLSFLFYLRHHFRHYFRALLVRQLMFHVME